MIGQGIIVPIVTPLRNDDTIDQAGMRNLIDYLVKGGVHGIFVMGSTGEFARLTYETWVQGVQAAIECTHRRVPTYVGVSAPSIREVLLRIRVAKDAGADAVVLSPGYYYPYSQDEVFDLYVKAGSPELLPLFAYNIPAYTQVTIAPHTLHRIVRSVPLAGIKDSSGDMSLLEQYLDLGHGIPRFSVLVGSESLLHRAFKAGATGAVPSLGNVFPALLRDVYESAQNHDWSRVEDLCQRIAEINRLNSLLPSSLGVIAWKKLALEYLGICSAHTTEPAPRYSEEMRNLVRETVRKHLSELNSAP